MQNTLDIRIEGISADLSAGMQFDLELLNSLFNIESPEGSRALGITLPFTPHNNDLFGFIHHPQSATTKRNYQTDIYVSTNLVDSGYTYLKDAKTNYPLDFTSNLAEFFGAYQRRLLTDIDLGTVLIPSNLSDTLATPWQIDNGCVFPPISNTAYYEKNIPGTFDGIVNKYSAGAYVSTSPKTPMFFVKHVLERVGTLAGVTYTGEFWNDANTAKLLLYNTREATVNTTIERRTYMPEMTIAQLIMGLRKTFNLYLRFDIYRKTLRMDYAKSVYASTCDIDWSPRAPKIRGGSPVTVPGLELAWSLDTNDQLYKDAFFDPYATTISEGTRLRVQSPFRTLKMVSGLPTTQQFGITANQLDKKCQQGLLSWQGLVSSVPTADNTFGTATLKWSGTGNLYETYWKSEETFRQNGYRIEERVGLNAAQLAKISARLRGEDSGYPLVHMNGTNYLIERIVVPSQNTNLPLVTAWRM